MSNGQLTQTLCMTSQLCRKGSKNKERQCRRGSLFTFLPGHCESDRQGNHMRRRIIKWVRSAANALPGSSPLCLYCFIPSLMSAKLPRHAGILRLKQRTPRKGWLNWIRPHNLNSIQTWCEQYLLNLCHKNNLKSTTVSHLGTLCRRALSGNDEKWITA